MLKSKLIISTTDARPISKRLYHHWRSRMETQESENKIVFIFKAEEDIAEFVYDENQLAVTLSTQTHEAHEKLQEVLKNHINRMAKQEFSETWQSETNSN